MKRIFITLLILSGIYSAASAQQKGDVQFGVNTGLNFSTITNSDGSFTDGYNSYLTGVNFGFSAEYYFSDRWSIKGKLIYDQKGSGDGYITETQTNDQGEMDQVTYSGLNFHFNYVTVPIMASWHFGRMRNWYLHFGPYVGFLTSAKASSPGPEFGGSLDIKDAVNSVDGGLALGIGVKIPISKNVSLFLEDDGQAGVANVFKQNDGFSNALTERSSLNVGLVFNVK